METLKCELHLNLKFEDLQQQSIVELAAYYGVPEDDPSLKEKYLEMLSQDMTSQSNQGSTFKKPALEKITSGIIEQNEYHPNQEINKIISILTKPSDQRQTVEISYIIPKIKNVAFFKEQNIQGKDLLDVSEMLSYEFFPEGSIIYKNGDPNDKMYIILDGQVEFSNDMEKYPLSVSQIYELEADMSVKDLGQQFQKFINATGINEIKAKRQLRRAMTFKNGSPFLEKLKSMLSNNFNHLIRTYEEKSSQGYSLTDGSPNPNPMTLEKKMESSQFMVPQNLEIQEDEMENGSENSVSGGEPDIALSPQTKQLDKSLNFNRGSIGRNLECIKDVEERSSDCSVYDQKSLNIREEESSPVVTPPSQIHQITPVLKKFQNSYNDTRKIRSNKSFCFNPVHRFGAANDNCDRSHPDSPERSNSASSEEPNYINIFHTLKTNDNFGINFLLKCRDPKSLYKSLCTTYCKTNCYLATLSVKSFEKIQDRIEKKIQQQELQFLRQVHQFNNMGKRVLRYILHNCKPIKMKRNQVLVKEGEKKKRIFIVKEGTFSVSKNVLMPKSSEQQYQQKLLTSKTHVAKRFRSTFNRQVGLKVENNLALLLAGPGKLLGDYESLNDLPSQFQVVCHSLTATALILEQEDYIAIRNISEESYQELQQISQEQQNEILKTYIDKIRDTQYLKSNAQDNGDKDIQELQANLMYEMFWDRTPTSIDKFALKRHMQEEKQNKSLIKMRNTEYQEFKESEWAQQRLFQKPKSSLKMATQNELHDQKQILRLSKDLAFKQLTQTFTSKKTMTMKIDLNVQQPFLKQNYVAPISEMDTTKTSLRGDQSMKTTQRPQSVNVNSRPRGKQIVRKIQSNIQVSLTNSNKRYDKGVSQYFESRKISMKSENNFKMEMDKMRLLSASGMSQSRPISKLSKKSHIQKQAYMFKKKIN